MNLGLKLSLATAGGGQRMDADAAAYIAALEDGGATVSSVQSGAIDTFIRAEKSGERWDLIKRLYLPIWGIAAPNAICMKSLTSGTFVGDVTYGAGFVQGDGESGYFAGNGNLQDVLGVGATMLASNWVISIEDTAGGDLCGAIVTANRMWWGAFSATVNETVIGRNTINARATSNYTGLFIGSRTSSTRLDLYRRRLGTFTDEANSTTESDLNIPNIAPFFAGAYSNNTTPAFAADPAKQGGFGYGLPFTRAQAVGFAENITDLYTTLTDIAI